MLYFYCRKRINKIKRRKLKRNKNVRIRETKRNSCYNVTWFFSFCFQIKLFIAFPFFSSFFLLFSEKIEWNRISQTLRQKTFSNYKNASNSDISSGYKWHEFTFKKYKKEREREIE